MTSADTMSEQDTNGTTAVRTVPTARVLAAGSLLFLVIGLALLLVAAMGLAYPEQGFGEYLTYGRAMPAALNALVFGWLTLGLLAVVHRAVPLLTGGSPALALPALGAGLLAFAGAGAGVGAILIGESAGGRLLEMPWYADAALVVAYLVTAVAVTATIRRGGAAETPVAVWYLGVAPWMLFLSYALGAIPGMTGAPAELQSAFTATAIYGLWLAPAAVGGGYWLVSRLVPEASFHPRLGRIGFWSLGFTWALTAARTLQYGPMPEWMETIPVLFAMGLIVATLTIAADFAFALRGRWDSLVGSIPLRLFAVGTGFFLLVPGHMLLQSFRSSSSVVHFTAWESGFEYLALLGAFTMWTLGLLIHLTGAFRGAGRVGRYAVVVAALGTLFAVGTRWVAGLQQGYTWLGGVEAGTHANFGDGFRNTVAPLAGTETLTLIGLAIAAAGFLVLAGGAVVGAVTAGGDDAAATEFVWPDTHPFGSVRRGAVVVFAFAALVAFAMPAFEIGTEPTILADTSRSFEDGSPEQQGRELYVAEGCWYCHTQQVRPIVTDVGLGPVSVAGDYAYDPPGVFGVARIGPDLAHAGSRAPTDDVGWIYEHLLDPRVERPWSTMPSYDHLGDGELAALAAYVAGLE